jgi:hypothetical protein
MLVDVVHGGHDALLELVFGGDADVAQDGASELRAGTGFRGFLAAAPGLVIPFGGDTTTQPQARAFARA